MSTLRTTTISNAGGTKSVPTDTVVDGTAKAWVNFNGTGTVAIRASFNVGSITDNATGDYTVNFTNAMADANYSFSGCSSIDGSKDPISLNSMTASGIRIATGFQAQPQPDKTIIAVAIFR